MDYTKELLSARLIKRYKRFLADVILDDGTQMTVHCANTGAMTGCAVPGSKVWLLKSDNMKRKYLYSWELVELSNPLGYICINTARANQVIEAALSDKKITAVANYHTIQREYKYANGSRVDFFLREEGLPDVYLEVKSVTLHVNNSLGAFPDAVTLRGQKHLKDLLAMKKQGARAILVFCVLHSQIKEVTVADQIDPVYGELLREVMQQGVEVYCYSVDMSLTALKVDQLIALRL